MLEKADVQLQSLGGIIGGSRQSKDPISTSLPQLWSSGEGEGDSFGFVV